MRKKIVKQRCGYVYTCEDETWSITTDYINGKIYLNVLHDDDDIDAIENFGIAISKAVADMKKDLKL